MSFSLSIPSLWQRLAKVPFVSTLAIVLLLQIVGEQFPFSPFPMYSGFSDETTVLYVTDAKDAPLPIKEYFRLSASKVKKAYNTELKRICKAKGYDDGDAKPEDLQAAGQATLAFLKTQTRAKVPEKIGAHGLRLYRVSLSMDKKGFHKTTEMVGELAK